MNIKIKAALFTASLLALSYAGFQFGALVFSNVSLTSDEFKEMVAILAIGFLIYTMYTLVLARLKLSDAYKSIEQNRE